MQEPGAARALVLKVREMEERPTVNEWSYTDAVVRTKAFKTVGAMVVVVGGLWFICWRSLQPKIRTASEAEVRATLPPDLLVTTPFDAAANGRFKRLVSLCSGYDHTLSNNLTEAKSTKERIRIAQKFWASNHRLLTELAKILDAGPIQCTAYPLADKNEFSDSFALASLSQLLTWSARSFASSGDFKTAVEMVCQNIKLGDRFWRSGGTLMDYLSAILIDGESAEALSEIDKTSGFPVSDCKLILSTLTPAPYPDEYLADAIRTDFQDDALRKLPDPTNPLKTASTGAGADEDRNGQEPIVGTYDALETTRLMGGAFESALVNVRRPLSQFDPSESKVIERETEDLPGPPDPKEPNGISKSLRRFVYRVLMDNARNSLGRKLLSDTLNPSMDPSLVKNSDNWRAQRDVVRVYLASRIYRAAHGGHLPSSTGGFVPILGAWPTDPFNGKPMIYNPKKEVVYSVGENLIDDGDRIADQEIGISLKQ